LNSLRAICGPAITSLALAGCTGLPSPSTTATSTASTSPAPLTLYTDITSGPNTGGENGDGIYLTVFGKNFGTGQLGTAVRVYVGGVEVKRYMNPGMVPVASRGRADIQEIATQIGLLGQPASTPGSAPSAPLPVKVVVNGVASNPSSTSLADPTFTITPGTIYFVNNVSGVDTTDTSSGGTFAAPFRSVQLAAGQGLSFSIQPASVSGAWGRVRAGDFLVMRGTGISWTGGLGYGGYFLRTLNKSGCALGTSCAQGGGTSSGPITLMGYPGEDVFINGAYASGANGTVSSADTARIAQGFGSYINVVDLRIEGGNYDGPVNTQAGGGYWRIVNNELTAATASAAIARAGGIHGSGPGHFWVGNHIHDIYCGSNGPSDPLENHGIYIGDTGTFEIAYNLINNIFGGSGFQTHIGGTALSVDHVHFHHNIVHDVNKHGINLAEGARNDIVIWNNVVYNTVGAGLRMGGTSMLNDAKIYNNLFYNTDLEQNSATGAITNDMMPAPNQVDIRNNIFWPSPNTKYNSGSPNPDFTGGIGTITHNLWFGGSNGVPAFDSMPRTGNPLFVAGTLSPIGVASFILSPATVLTLTQDFHVLTGSPVVDTGDPGVAAVVIDDFDVATTTLARTLRPLGAGYDIGPYER